MDATPEVHLDIETELGQFAWAQGDDVFLAALRRLIPAARAEAVRRGDGQPAHGLLMSASFVLRKMQCVLTPPLAGQQFLDSLWQHAAFWELQSDPGPYAPDREAVEAVAASYLKLPWMACGHLDWALTDALILGEVLGYRRESASAMIRPWTKAWVVERMMTVALPWLVEAVILGLSGAWLWAEFSADVAPFRWWWAAGVCAYVLWTVIGSLIQVPRIIRSRRTKRAAMPAFRARLLAMQICYSELAGPVLDPTRVRDILLEAEKLDIRWPRAVWPLLETTIARNPHVWHTEL